MKSKTFLLISTFLISFVLSCDSKGSTIVRVLQEIKNSLPDLIKKVKNLKECQTSALKSICRTGFNYWNSQSNAKVWKGIGRDKENIENFFAILMNDLPIEKEDAKRILPFLKLAAKVGDFTEVSSPDIISKNATESAKKGYYFSIFMESNCENKNEFDLLFTSIKINFELGKDIFLLEEGSGNFFSGSYDQKAVEHNADLNREQYKALFNLLQFSSYLNALDLMSKF